MIELKNLTKVFNLSSDEKDKRVALDHVNLKINDGEFVTIIGSNGSGKTTTMNLIAGTYVPTEGDILLSGMPISQMKEFKRAKYFGRVFQDPRMGTTAEMSVLENLEIAYRRGKNHSPFRWGFSSETVRDYFISQVKQFDLGLEDRMNQKVGRMSGGQRQALTLLMATLQKPDILLLDEHTAALDPKTAKKVLEVTDSVVKENKLTTIMITHNMKDALRYGDRLLMYKDGKIVFDVKGKEKEQLTIEKLLDLFEEN